MSLHSDWLHIARSQRNDTEQQEFWSAYYELEKNNYEKILKTPDIIHAGKLEDLAKEFTMDLPVFTGFIDGANTSFKNGEYDLESLTPQSDISLEFDYEKLYYNMLEAKADWLFNLPQWEGILSDDKRKGIAKEYRVAHIYIAEKTTGRNDPCPCGSGKKFKKCCGVNS